MLPYFIAVLRIVGDLLKCEPEILQKALIVRTVATKNESFKKALSPLEVEEQLYGFKYE